ncbi:MAG: PD40 domain-containing protein, partial [Chloroflexi bacterium]|nr:PD40 domain-containing protein [Chloroflexota bacterium]
MLGRCNTRLLAALVVAAFGGLLFGTLTWGSEPLTDRVSVSSLGAEGTNASQSASLSADGRFVVFSSDASDLVDDDTNSRDIFVRDRQNGTTELVSLASDGTQANRPALFPAISGDGRFVVYESEADNLVPGDTNEASDIFC